MKKEIRTKLLIKRIDDAIKKNQRRIARISEDNFMLRQTRDALQKLPKGTTLTKKELDAMDQKNRVGKYYDPVYHEEQRDLARKAAADKAIADAQKVDEATAEAIKDNADQEIGSMSVEGQ